MINDMTKATQDQIVSSTAYRFRLQDFMLGAQMLFVAFGALVLVPILARLDPNVALFTSGLGTLCFQLVTGGKVPVYLASSFCFYCTDNFKRREVWFTCYYVGISCCWSSLLNSESDCVLGWFVDY